VGQLKSEVVQDFELKCLLACPWVQPPQGPSTRMRPELRSGRILAQDDIRKKQDDIRRDLLKNPHLPKAGRCGPAAPDHAASMGKS
jgi:hypothetical protein